MSLRPLAIAILAWAGLFGGPRAEAATAADFLYATLPKAGSEPYDLPYRYLVPAGYSAATAYPLIVFLHGSGERGNNNTSQLNNNANGALQLVSTANQATYPCFMLAPQANMSDGWNGNTLPQVIRAIRVLESTHHIDHDRIYVTGLSMGGAGTCSIITSNPTVFAAAIPMSGWGAGSYEKIVHIPQWFFHAANDGTVGVGGSDNAVSALRNLGCPVIYTRYTSGGHGIWPTAYATPYLLPWMMAQRRNRPVAGTPILTITSPTSHIVPPPPANTLNVAGTVTLPTGAGSVAAVGWGFNPGANSLNVASLTVATGTTSWTAAATTTTTATLFLAVAEVPSWSTSLGGVTTLNDWLWNVPRSANTTAPSVAITAPSGTGSWGTTATSMTLSGTAAGAGGKSIKQITWRNDRGGNGQALGTTAWSVTDLGLASGTNVITVTVRDSASITGTTTITVQVGGGANTAPTISAMAAQSTNEDVAKTGIAFTVGDAETAAGSLTVSGASSNTALVPASGIVFGGSGANRTVTLTPAANQNGTSTITITVSDGALTASRSFILTVNAVNDAPTINAIAAQSTNEDVAKTGIAFTVGDAETAAGSLTVSGTSSNTTLVPAAGIVFGGSGANRTVALTPAADQNGTATITITVSDGAATATSAFTLTVNAINDAPTIGTITDVTTTRGVATAALPFTVADIDSAVAGLTLSGTSSNTTLVPVAGITFGGSGANRTVTVTPAANQSGTATITVAVSDGAVSVSRSFTVTVLATNTAPTIGAIAAQSTNEDVAKTGIAFTVGDAETAAGSLTVSGTSSNTALVPAAGIVFGGSGANRTVSLTPAANQNGTATITVTVSDGALTASRTFTLTVNAVNDAPTVSVIASAIIVQDTATAALPITVGDIETAAASLTLTGTSSDIALVPASGLAFGGTGANRTVTVTPAAGRSGTATITVTVSDGALNASRSFAVTVTSTADVTPPAQPSAPQVDDPASTSPMVSGIAEPGAVIAIRDGGTVIGTVTVGTDGTWNWHVDPVFTSGEHRLSVVATDAAGNSSMPSATTVVTTPAATVGGNGDGGDGGGGGCGMGSGLALLFILLLGCGLRLGMVSGRRLSGSDDVHPGNRHG